MDSKRQNALAARFRALHKPGEPVVLCNVYDAATAGIIATNAAAKAVATASYAIAAVNGVEDDKLTFEQNLASLRAISPVVINSGLPWTVDAQDGYGDKLEEVIASLIELGAVGCNLEDVEAKSGKIYPIEIASKRVAKAVEVATRQGVPQFAVNARTDILATGGTITEAISRGQAYLAAGATTVFVWGGPSGRGISRGEVETLVKAFDGRLNVILKLSSGGLTIPELKEIGVARISVGPALYGIAMKAYSDAANELLQAAA